MTDRELAQRVKAAACAGWWTVLIGAVGLGLAWIGVVAVMGCRPECLMKTVIGGNITWDQLQVIYLWFFGVMKLILLVMLLASLWLTIWACKLKKIPPTLKAHDGATAHES